MADKLPKVTKSKVYFGGIRTKASFTPKFRAGNLKEAKANHVYLQDANPKKNIVTLKLVIK